MVKACDIQIRDPFVVCEGGLYYLFGSTDSDIWKSSGTGFDVYTSSNLQEFEGPFAAFRPPSGFFSETNFWAPEVHNAGGEYFMFATFLPKAGWHYRCRGTAVLKSAGGILGPYEPLSEGTLTPHDWECLDGTLFFEDGVPYMVFCHEWKQTGDGEICARALSASLKEAAGEPFLLFRSSEARWSYPLKGRAPGSYVTDGPFVWRKDGGGLVMLWSAFGKDGEYCLGAANSASGHLRGPWTQEDAPRYSADGGHGMIFRDARGLPRIALHSPNKTPQERLVLLPF
ncbi:MAG: glycoside hydrolase family 43 protein [Spirochaetaceae bacterium]|jgi:GH43 family beta-xylosidase|nr:glycoside hydrolase family 43 protein [Spirochaetaceae bacterium]